MLCYVDDCIIFTKKRSEVADSFIHSLHNGPENFILESEGSLDKYLGVDVDRRKGGSIHLSQSGFLARFLALVCINENENAKDTPFVKPMLHRDLDGPVRRYVWNYRQAVGMLGYLQGSTRPDIATAVHQCTRACNDPKLSHEIAIRIIRKYIHENKDKGIILGLILLTAWNAMMMLILQEIGTIQMPVILKMFRQELVLYSIANSQEFMPRTKHIALQYDHFLGFMDSGQIEIHHIDTMEQIADIFTKLLKLDIFQHLQYKLVGW